MVFPRGIGSDRYKAKNNNAREQEHEKGLCRFFSPYLVWFSFKVRF
jgi:hypothetical protein